MSREHYRSGEEAVDKSALIPGTVNGSVLARHVYSIIQGVITVVLISFGVGVVDLRERLARIESKAEERGRIFADQREMNLLLQGQITGLQKELTATVLSTTNAAAAAAAAAAADGRRRK